MRFDPGRRPIGEGSQERIDHQWNGNRGGRPAVVPPFPAVDWGPITVPTAIATGFTPRGDVIRLYVGPIDPDRWRDGESRFTDGRFLRYLHIADLDLDSQFVYHGGDQFEGLAEGTTGLDASLTSITVEIQIIDSYDVPNIFLGSGSLHGNTIEWRVGFEHHPFLRPPAT